MANPLAPQVNALASGAHFDDDASVARRRNVPSSADPSVPSSQVDIVDDKKSQLPKKVGGIFDLPPATL